MLRHLKLKKETIKLIKLKNTIKLKYNKDNKVKEETKSFRIDDEKLLEKYKAIWTKIEDLKNIKLNALPVYDGRHVKTK